MRRGLKTSSKKSEQFGLRSPTLYSDGNRKESGRAYADFPVQIALQDAAGFIERKNSLEDSSTTPGLRKSLRKEVIQPQVPLRLPCYDLVPVTSLAVGTVEIRRLRALPASMT
jgi:hypothetical protein